MSRVTSEMRAFAKCLIEAEDERNRPARAKAPADFQVCERLRPQLATLMGSGGCRALFSRALALAGAELPKLSAARVGPDGTLERWAEAEEQLSPAQIGEARIVLIAHLLGLLVAFIGPNLTVRLMRETWPKLSPRDANFGKGNKK